METAGAGEMPEDAERKGIGTPATRAAILEKLVSTGLVERKKAKKITNLLPTQAGSSLVTVLPEVLQSPLLTADWEQRLGEVERGELSPEDFMAGIAAMVDKLVKTYQPVPGAAVLFPSNKESVGPCPRCGGAVTESKKGFFCENRECRFVLWKDSKFFTAKKKTLTKSVAAALLNKGRVKLTGCFSEKTGKTYDATVVLEDDGTKTNYVILIHQGKIIFEEQKDDLIYNYGVVKCGKKQFSTIDPDDYLISRKEKTCIKCLVADKAAFQKKYKDIVVDNASVEDSPLFILHFSYDSTMFLLFLPKL